MEKPLVSIVVRTMGRPQLARALKCLVQQTWDNLEIVLVNASGKKLPQIERIDRPIQHISKGMRLYRPDAANAGIQAAKGDWIGFLDEDDWLEPNHVEVLVRSVLQKTGFYVVYGDLCVHENEKKIVHSHGYWKRNLTLAPIVWINTVLVSREIVDSNLNFDSSFHLLEDWDFIISCSHKSDFLHVPEVTANYDPYSGDSGGGSGINRDNTRLEPYRKMLGAKWGLQFSRLMAISNKLIEDADACMKKSEWGGAIEKLRDALSFDPGNPIALNKIAKSHLKTSNGLEALLAMRRACDTDPDDFRLLADCVLLESAYGNRSSLHPSLNKLNGLVRTNDDITKFNRISEYLKRF